MKHKEFMIQSLTALLEEGETLLHPIYGILQQGNTQWYGYFGLTGDHLLIALLSPNGKQITDTIRIPLDIKFVKAKQGLVFRQYTIDIGFGDGAPCRIVASPKVLLINTQKENFPLFLAHLQSKSSNTKGINLKAEHGKRIRWQYFSVFLYMMLSAMPMPIIMIAVSELKEGTFVWAELPNLLFMGVGIWCIILLPVFVLVFLNRFLFGKILCVINEKGVFTETDFIPWNSIKRIEYHPELPGRHKMEFTYASLIVQGRQVEEYAVDIMHFPIYGLRSIREYLPNMPIETSKSKKRFIVFMILLPTVMSFILPLFF